MPVALQIDKLAAVLDAVVEHVVGVFLVFPVRHTEERMPVVSADERVARYLRSQPFRFLFFLRFIVFIDIFLRRVLRGKIVPALRPRSVLYVIPDGYNEIALALYNGNVMTVLVLFDMYDGQALFRFRPVPFFLHFSSFFFFLRYFAAHRQKLVRLDSDISILSVCAVLLELFHFREDRLILIDRLAEYRKKPAAALLQHICPVPAPVVCVLFVDERIINFLFRLLLLFFRRLFRRKLGKVFLQIIFAGQIQLSVFDTAEQIAFFIRRCGIKPVVRVRILAFIRISLSA